MPHLLLTSCNRLCSRRKFRGTQPAIGSLELWRQKLPQRFQEVPELERLPNKAANLRRANCPLDDLLAISAGQYHLYFWHEGRGFDNDVVTGGAWNRHV